MDVPAKMSARVRIFTTGQGRKTDVTDAHSIALVGVRMSGLRPVINDEQLEVLRMCVDRRRSLGEEHTRKICQLHKLLLELIPGGRHQLGGDLLLEDRLRALIAESRIEMPEGVPASGAGRAGSGV